MRYIIALLVLLYSASAFSQHVVDVVPITRTVWHEGGYQETVYCQHDRGGGNLLGAIVGGLIGSQIGGGSGRDIAIGAGALLGYEAGGHRYRESTCTTVRGGPRSIRQDVLEGYMVRVRYGRHIETYRIGPHSHPPRIGSIYSHW